MAAHIPNPDLDPINIELQRAKAENAELHAYHEELLKRGEQIEADLQMRIEGMEKTVESSEVELERKKKEIDRAREDICEKREALEKAMEEKQRLQREIAVKQMEEAREAAHV